MAVVHSRDNKPASVAIRQQIAQALESLVHRVIHDKLKDVTLVIERPVRGLDPMKGECPNDGYCHWGKGPIETWTLTLTYDSALSFSPNAEPVDGGE